jgi:hypothetical protein
LGRGRVLFRDSEVCAMILFPPRKENLLGRSAMNRKECSVGGAKMRERSARGLSGHEKG